ncbi:MAG: KH domain-containing protein, partial [Candidatus Omnitrophota bacterium]|nr:KH domain-containing protein [Candidatus Omnitrophota bacterium]
MEKIIKLETHEEAQGIFGSRDENIKAIEKELKVKITLRGEHLKISGTINNIKKASGLIEYMLTAIRSG